MLNGLNPAIAFAAGLASFVSPCVLPLVPAYLAYLGSRATASAPIPVGPDHPGVRASAAPVGPDHPGHPAPGSTSIALAGAGFVVGLSLVFILFFYVFTLAVQPVRAYVPVVAGVLVIVMALHIAGLIHLPFMSYEYRVMKQAPRTGGAAGGFLLGMGFAGGWTPCIGVTLGAVLSSAATLGTTAQGLSLMLAYCLGLAVPFLALAFAFEGARPLIAYVNRHRRAIDLASAAVLVVMGVLLLTDRLTILAAGITQLVPSWPSPSL